MKDAIMKNLIIVDYQYDFANPKGSLYVPGGETIADPIMNLLRSGNFDFVVATKDMHPADHCSFKDYGGLWPSHCVAGTRGQELMLDRNSGKYIDYILHKGRDPRRDSYSAFFDNEKKVNSGLGGLLKPRNLSSGKDVRHTYICGLAFDYCVKFTALDALMFSSKVFIISDAVEAVVQNAKKLYAVYEELEKRGVKFIDSQDVISPPKRKDKKIVSVENEREGVKKWTIMI